MEQCVLYEQPSTLEGLQSILFTLRIILMGIPARLLHIGTALNNAGVQVGLDVSNFESPGPASWLRTVRAVCKNFACNYSIQDDKFHLTSQQFKLQFS